jgi:hypothetical protein
MRMVLALTLSLAAPLALGGCAAVGAVVNDQSYALDSGIASYDALQRAGTLCKSRGGTVKPPTEGDNRMLSNYTCSIPAGAKAP